MTEQQNCLLTVLDRRIRNVAQEVFDEKFRTHEAVTDGTDSDAATLRARLDRVLAKEFISIAEAALLLNCSDGHIRNQITKAKKGQSKRPIPFCSLEGVTVFHLKELLAWSKQSRIARAAVN